MHSAHSTRTDADATATAIRDAIPLAEPSLVVYFASPRDDDEALARALRHAFPTATTVGCTTSGEISPHGMTKGSVVAMAFEKGEVPRACAAFVDDVHDETAVPRALSELERRLETPIRGLDPSRWVGLVFVDGMSVGEEKVMDALSARVNVPFVGGSAGDDTKFVSTRVMADGRCASNAAVLVLLEVPRGYAIWKTQSFDDTGKRLRVTRADPATRTVFEFDGRPAAVAYAEAIGVPTPELPSRFMTNPLGLMIDGEPFVRSPQQVKGESVVFYCNVEEGMELGVLSARDIVSDTRAFLAERRSSSAPERGMLLFNCILRTLELEAKGQCDAYASLFASTPTVGFSTYGEQYVGHINQTATMLVFR